MNKSKRIISLLAALAMTLPAFTLAACGDKEYKGENVAYVAAENAEVKSNGGFAVETKGYVYFINGKEESTADNTYGDVVKGSLMRITKADMAAGKYDAAKIVVPSLFVTGNYDSGIYIYGDYVYYATPTTDKDNAGTVQNSYLDFKRATLDGKAGPDDYFFRLASNTTKYRFVEEGGVVYCLYEESGALKSFNTKTKTTTVLVSGAGTFYYDVDDLASGDVYYTMSVTRDIDSDNSSTAKYNQIYRVNAAATATVKVDSATAKYTVKEGNTEIATYSFDKSFMVKKNTEAKEKDQDEVYDFDDYATYPYVNLGKLVLDGVGKNELDENISKDTRFNKDANSIASACELDGYTYTLQAQTNGGLYFTREAVNKTGNTENKALYYLNTAKTNGEWNTVTANGVVEEGEVKNMAIDVVSKNTTNASASAVYTYSETEGHSYMYVSNSALFKSVGGKDFKMIPTLSDATLWKIEGDYLYYYGTGTNGKNLSRINYTGDADKYNEFTNSSKATEYSPVTLALVDWSDSWYKPEFINDGTNLNLLYANAQSFGTGATAYNYINLTKLGTNEEITANAEKIEEINEYIAEGSSSAQGVMKYYFRNGKLDSYTAVKDLYSTAQQQEVTDFVALFGEGKDFAGALESSFIPMLSRWNEDDAEAIATAWENSLLQEEEEEEDDEIEAWVLGLIIGGCALVAIAVVVVTIVIVKKKEKAKEKAKEEIVTAYKRKKIDTTDDKSIDVYAEDEGAKEVTEEAPVEEAPAEESTEPAPEEETPAEEAPAEESAEPAPAEEAPAEEALAEESAEPAPAEETPAEDSAEKPADAE